MARAPRGAAGKRSFHQELVLNRWMLGFFKGGSLGALKLRLGDTATKASTTTARRCSSTSSPATSSNRSASARRSCAATT